MFPNGNGGPLNFQGALTNSLCNLDTKNDPQLSRFPTMPSLQYHGQLESKAKMRLTQAIFIFFVVTCCVYPANSVAAE